MKRDNIKLPAASRIEELEHRIDDLEADLDRAVEIAYLRGATEWVRLHYPSRYERLHSQFDSCVFQ